MLFWKKFLRWILMLPLTALLAGCAGTNGDYCQLTRVIWWGSQEELLATPIAVTRQILIHNETFEALCPGNSRLAPSRR